MPTLDPSAFLDQLAAFMAGATSPALAYTTSPRALWLYLADEEYATDPRSVLFPYVPGELPIVPVVTQPIQCKTVGTDDAVAMAQSLKLWQTLRDAGGQPLRNKALTNYRFSVLRLQSPALISRDDRGRPEIIFNFDAKVIVTS